VPPDSVRCIRTIQGPSSHSRFSQARYAIIHRTVWWASGQRLSNTQRSTLTGVSNSATQKSEQQSQRGTGWHRTVRCRKRTKPPTVDRAPDPNGWVTWRHTGQPTVPVWWRTVLSGAPIASNLPNGYFGG
jgi:hypothetical protein